ADTVIYISSNCSNEDFKVVQSISSSNFVIYHSAGIRAADEVIYLSAGINVAEEVIYLSSSSGVADYKICIPNASYLSDEGIEEIVASIFSTFIKPLR
ncbi:MAG: hypothetical protein P8N58_01820, partial [Emcibacteraceae bacterium]|nr:hypothetical protein [Emcibacteraceae bacterium]